MPKLVYGIIGRFKPLHKEAASLLEAMCSKADEVVIGIGSTNAYDVRNPFTAEETQAMIEAHLSQQFQNYRFVFIPDYHNDERWSGAASAAMGNLDALVTGNEFVKVLLSPRYEIIIPETLSFTLELSGTAVRVAMAKGDEWREMVPPAVADYLEKNGLIERFRREFGKETAERYSNQPIDRSELSERGNLAGSKPVSIP